MTEPIRPGCIALSVRDRGARRLAVLWLRTRRWGFHVMKSGSRTGIVRVLGKVSLGSLLGALGLKLIWLAPGRKSQALRCAKSSLWNAGSILNSSMASLIAVSTAMCIEPAASFFSFARVVEAGRRSVGAPSRR
jgi:hypothetical protein